MQQTYISITEKPLSSSSSGSLPLEKSFWVLHYFLCHHVDRNERTTLFFPPFRYYCRTRGWWPTTRRPFGDFGTMPLSTWKWLIEQPEFFQHFSLSRDTQLKHTFHIKKSGARLNDVVRYIKVACLVAKFTCSRFFGQTINWQRKMLHTKEFNTKGKHVLSSRPISGLKKI